MSPQNNSLDQSRFIDLNQINAEILKDIFTGDYPLLPGIYLPSDFRLGVRLKYADALAIETARQISDGLSIPLKAALRFVAYAGAIENFFGTSQNNFRRRRPLTDFWMAVLGIRTTSKESYRSSVPVGSFGPGEALNQAHFSGPLHQVTAELNQRLILDDSDHDHDHESDPAWTIFANVSAADRRLRKRAAELGIKIEGNEFA